MSHSHDGKISIDPAFQLILHAVGRGMTPLIKVSQLVHLLDSLSAVCVSGPPTALSHRRLSLQVPLYHPVCSLLEFPVICMQLLWGIADPFGTLSRFPVLQGFRIREGRMLAALNSSPGLGREREGKGEISCVMGDRRLMCPCSPRQPCWVGVETVVQGCAANSVSSCHTLASDVGHPTKKPHRAWLAV